MKKLTILFITISATIAAYAQVSTYQDANGLCYSCSDYYGDATVTYKSSTYGQNYSGTSYVIPNTITYKGKNYTVTAIGHQAFRGCNKLRSVSLPNTIKEIYSSAFSGCTALDSIIIPNSVTSIGDGAFSGCQNLKYVKLSDALTTIKESVFYSCYSLKEIKLPNSITTISSHAFEGCDALKTMTMPLSLSSIATDAIKTPSSQSTNHRTVLEMIIFDAENIEDYFASKVNKVLYDAGHTESREFLVNGQSITDLIIPETIDTISDFLFYNCDNITTITLHENCKLLKKAAFYACSNLIGVILKSQIPPILQSSMFNSTPLCYIPCGTLENYATSAWRIYTPTFVEQTGYNLSITSSNNLYGIAKITSRIDCETVMLTAIPNDGCTFIKWSDGNTQATRYLQLTEDTSLTAYFTKEGYTIHVYQDCNTTIE